jgi:hypothetical protein
MGGKHLIRFHLDWSQLMPDAFMRVDQGYQERVDQVMAWAAAYRIRSSSIWSALLPEPASGPSCPLSRGHVLPATARRLQATTKYLLQRCPSVRLRGLERPEPGQRFWVGRPAEFAATVNAAVAGADEAGVATRSLPPASSWMARLPAAAL